MMESNALQEVERIAVEQLLLRLSKTTNTAFVPIQRVI